MLSNAHEKYTEQLAKKHGNATNQSSSFSYLLKGKMVRTDRLIDDKQNEKSSMPQTIQSQYQSKTLKIKAESNRPTSASLKVNKIEEELFSLKGQPSCKSQDTNQSITKYANQSEQLLAKGKSDFDLSPLSLNLSNPFALNQSNQKKTVEAFCMTDQCYCQKQLEIKVLILKKERDQLWDSINGIVRQNYQLKETLQVITRRKQNVLSHQTQTDLLQSTSFDIQTDSITQSFQQIQTVTYNIQSQFVQTQDTDNAAATTQTETTNNQIQLLQLRYQKAIRQKQDVMEFCESLYLHDISEELSECLSMKDVVSEYLSIKIDALSKQFDSQKAMLNRMYEQFINKFKRTQEDLLERNQALLIEIQQLKSVNKKIQQNLYLEQKKIESLQQSNYILNNEIIEAEEQITKYRNQAQKIKESLQSEKKGWEQKKKTYTHLLGSSHRTIKNLMAQMREFEGLASSSYSKHHLKSDKNSCQVGIDI